MSPIVYRISVLLGVLLAEVPIGTNLALFWLLWSLISGWFLLSRGAISPRHCQVVGDDRVTKQQQALSGGDCHQPDA